MSHILDFLLHLGETSTSWRYHSATRYMEISLVLIQIMFDLACAATYWQKNKPDATFFQLVGTVVHSYAGKIFLNILMQW